MLRALLCETRRKIADRAQCSVGSLLLPETQAHAVVCNSLGRCNQRPYAAAADSQEKASKQRKKVVILGTGWAAASLAKHVDTSIYAITVRDSKLPMVAAR